MMNSFKCIQSQKNVYIHRYIYIFFFCCFLTIVRFIFFYIRSNIFNCNCLKQRSNRFSNLIKFTEEMFTYNGVCRLYSLTVRIALLSITMNWIINLKSISKKRFMILNYKLRHLLREPINEHQSYIITVFVHITSTLISIRYE